jgi:hypothetical protein
MRMLKVILLAAVVSPLSAQSNQSLQGVWRMVELTIPDSPTGRRDPFGAYSAGTHTQLQPELMIFTSRHYSRTTDTAAQPRPTVPYKTPGMPTLEELQAEWGPFVANAGTYEVSGSSVTLKAIVAKNPRAQSPQNFTRLAFRIAGNTLWLTPIETEGGPITSPVTTKFARVE